MADHPGLKLADEYRKRLKCLPKKIRRSLGPSGLEMLEDLLEEAFDTLANAVDDCMIFYIIGWLQYEFTVCGVITRDEAEADLLKLIADIKAEDAEYSEPAPTGKIQVLLESGIQCGGCGEFLYVMCKAGIWPIGVGVDMLHLPGLTDNERLEKLGFETQFLVRHLIYNPTADGYIAQLNGLQYDPRNVDEEAVGIAIAMLREHGWKPYKTLPGTEETRWQDRLHDHDMPITLHGEGSDAQPEEPKPNEEDPPVEGGKA